MQYARWKEECRQMFPVVGSGRFITAPVINEDGQPIQEPLVLLESHPDKGQALPSQDNGGADIKATRTASGLETTNDKKVIQWMLTLHQIGWWHLLFRKLFFLCVWVRLDFYPLYFIINLAWKVLIVSHFIMIPCTW